MPTSPEPERPPPPTVSEPIRVLRLRRFDALAELMREVRPDPVPYRPAGTAPDPHPPSAEEDTRELPPVPGARAPGAPVRDAPGPGPRRTAVAVAVAAAALAGFGCALLLTGRPQAAAAPPAAPPHTAAPPATASAPPAATASAPPPAATAPDPDGPGTLRQGDSGPPVTALQRRLLRVPDVYRDGGADGTYDASLAEAVARFQLWYGVTGDERGVYGDDTRRALESRTGAGDG